MDVKPQIITAALGGDRAAFEQIVSACSDPIYRYVRLIVRDEHAAEDVAQNVFVRVFQRLAQFDASRGKFSTWIYRIARNAALNHVRDHRRVETELATPLPASGALSPEQQAQLQEQFQMLDRAVAGLPDHQRSAWILSELEGLTQAQVALIEGVPEGTVKSRVSRAKEALRKVLADQMGWER